MSSIPSEPRPQDGADTGTENVVPFLSSAADRELQNRAIREAERLARLSELERNLWLPKRAKDIGLDVTVLRSMVAVIVKAKKAEADAKLKEERRIEQRAAAKEKQKDKDEADKAKAKQKAELRGRRT